jgi:hypothetical protein
MILMKETKSEQVLGTGVRIDPRVFAEQHGASSKQLNEDFHCPLFIF